MNNENIINNIYSSYGTMIGKVCETTQKDYCDTFVSDVIKNDISIPQNINFSKPAIPTKIIDTGIPKEIKNIENINNIIGGSVNSESIQNSSNIDENNNGINIFGYNISTWTFILIIIIICIVLYFIYKFFFTNSNYITYTKLNNKSSNDILSKNKILNNKKSTDNFSNSSSDDSSDDSSDNSSDDSSKSKK